MQATDHHVGFARHRSVHRIPSELGAEDRVDRVGSDTVRLLGRKQTWERWTLTGADGAPRLHIDGWSFDAKHVSVDPVAARPNWPDDGVPTLAIVHGDLDAPGSQYAPLTRAALQARPVALWLLGHIHVPRLVTAPAAPPILYPGSPHALDPGETRICCRSASSGFSSMTRSAP